MIRPLLASALLALTLPAAAQSVPATSYTDMWWNPSESGWGVSIAQHAGSNQVFAVWYTYDPRAPDPVQENKPLWIVMPGGSWPSPTTLTGPVYVTNGTPFFQPWPNPNPAFTATRVGTFTFSFSDASHGTFNYDIAPPAGLASTDPAFGLPTLSGSKSIQRQSF